MNIKLFWNRTFAVPAFPPTWIIFQRFGGILAYVCIKLKLSPNLITIIGALLGTYASYQFIFLNNSTISSMILNFFFIVVYLIDCTDGQIARSTNKTSILGKWLDIGCDFYLNIIFSISCGQYLYLYFKDDRIFYSIFILLLLRNILLIIFSNQRSLGHNYKPSKSNLKTIIQILYDTPIYYLILCISRLNPEILFINIHLYILLNFSIIVYKKYKSD